jgi:hypothetical protein
VNEWPSGWFRDEKPKPPGGDGGSGGTAGEPTVGLPAGSAGAAPPGGSYARAAGGRGQRAGEVEAALVELGIKPGQPRDLGSSGRDVVTIWWEGIA